jgi:toxin ParE1/3/4
MVKFRFTNSAVADLTDIWDYTIENWSEKQADKYYKLIIDRCSEIAKNPKKGKEYNDVYPDLKGQRILKHIIFYRVEDNHSIEITRILHERMDLKAILKKLP